MAFPEVSFSSEEELKLQPRSKHTLHIPKKYQLLSFATILQHRIYSQGDKLPVLDSYHE